MCKKCKSSQLFASRRLGVHLRRRGTGAPHQVLSRWNDKKLYAPCGMRRGVERHGGKKRDALHNWPRNCQQLAEPGLAQRRRLCGAAGPRFVLLPSSASALEEERERGGTESPWPTRGSASCQDASSHSQLGNMCVDPKPRGLEGDHTPSLTHPTYTFQTDWS